MWWRGIIVALALAAVGGCRSGANRLVPGELRGSVPGPAYADVATKYNARTSRLGRVWARAVVSIEYHNENGKKRYEQGDGHFQLIQPSRLALSIGKLGKVMLWIGSDEQRYWVLEPRGERHSGVTGRHELVDSRKLDRLGIPVAPLDLIRLMGVEQLPEQLPFGAQVLWARNQTHVVVDLPSERGMWRYWIDPATWRPQAIQYFATLGEEPTLTARLAQYEPVRLRGVGGFFPRIASRIRIVHHASGSELRVSLEAMVDGGRGKLTPDAFDLSVLTEALGVRELVDLDSETTVSDSGD